jgi:hypothetical protein
MNNLRTLKTLLPGMILLFCLVSLLSPSPSVQAQTINPEPPRQPIKLIFIHHSCGQDWLTDGIGNLGMELGRNNYFVSDTYYGWGPDSIGDRTDIPDWTEWFVGPDHERYLAALYQENGQNSDYTRTLSNPGGENQIIMFKSCFPNSALSGRPDDPASDGEWFTVGHSKYVYNQLLTYFATRPDKLFIAITPPPLIDRSHAENAREFSRWLVEDWLAENNYPLSNVAVWDYHNVLTDPDNHHRFQGGSIEYIIHHGNGSLFYDSDGDDHPNPDGQRKSTAEFIPMLNIFYNNWIAGGGQLPAVSQEQPPAEAEPEQPEAETLPQAPFGAFPEGGMIDDFEGGPPPDTYGWEAFGAEGTQTTISCGPDSSIAQSGQSSLWIEFNVTPNDWATCSLYYGVPPDFRNTEGVSFDYHSSAAGFLFDINVVGGSPEAHETYLYTIETVPESVEGWVHMEIPWSQITGVEWEAYAGIPVDPAEINGFIFGFQTPMDAPNSGVLWIDNLRVLGGAPPAQPEAGVVPPPEQEGEEPAAPADEMAQEQAAGAEESEGEEEEGGRRLCRGSTAMIAMTVFLGVFFQVKSSRKRGVR